MALKPEQRKALDQCVRELHQQGIFRPPGRSLAAEDRYLFLSLGGQGAQTLLQIREAFEKAIPAEQLRRRVRFLAVDSDRSTRIRTTEVPLRDGTFQTRQEDLFPPDQFCCLDAQQLIPVLDARPELLEPLSPQSRERLDSALRNAPGCGAAGMRFLGRLLLYPGQNISQLQSLLNVRIQELTNGNLAPLHIFVIAGLSGGTGSALAVDVGYLIRHMLETLPGNLPLRCRINGILLTPDMLRGNHPVPDSFPNAFAALKELRHYLTLEHRALRYTAVYGNGYMVVSQRNVFDRCYLFGHRTNSIPSYAARDALLEELACLLLDLASAEVGHQSLATHIASQPCHPAALVSGKPSQVAPREADYPFCALGYGILPTLREDATLFRMKHLFDKVYDLLCCEAFASITNAREFLRDVIQAGVSTRSALMKAMDWQINRVFLGDGRFRCGPVSVLHLLQELPAELDQLHGMIRFFRPGRVSDESLCWIEEYARYLEHRVFHPQICALEALRDVLNASCDALTAPGNNSPFSVSNYQPEAVAFRRYLQEPPDSHVKQFLLQELLQELVANRQSWCDFSGPDAPALQRAISEFCHRIADQILPEPEAVLQAQLNPGFDPFACVESRASEPMLNLDPNGFSPQDFIRNPGVLLTPSAPPAPIPATVCIVPDRVSRIQLFSCIPAFLLNRIHYAEQDYEYAISHFGESWLHTSRDADGVPWRDYPSLIPLSSCCPREQEYYLRAQRLVQEARQYGLVDSFLLRLLPEQYRPVAENLIDVATAPDDRRADGQRLLEHYANRYAEDLTILLGPDIAPCELVQALSARGITLTEHPLADFFTVTTPHPGEPVDPDWIPRLESRLLRRSPRLMYELEATLMVLRHIPFS